MRTLWFYFPDNTDITSIDGSELGFDKDIKWKFPKVAGIEGLYSSPPSPLDHDDTLVSKGIIALWIHNSN